MAKTKKNWIEEIIAFGQEAIGDVTQEQLEAMNIGQLKMLKKDIEEQLAEENNTDPVLEKDKTAEPTGKFESMCGSEFDPKKASSCNKQCSKDFPEAFQACSDNFKKKPAKKTTAQRKAGGGKTIWNHVANSQAGKIDECIISGKPMSLKEIAEYAVAKEPRTLAHMQHLVFDWNIEILYNTRKNAEDKDEKIYFWSEKDKRRTGDKLEGKSAYKTKGD